MAEKFFDHSQPTPLRESGPAKVVSQPAGQRICPLADFSDQPGLIGNVRGSGQPLDLVRPKGGGDIAGRAQTRRENDRIFYGLTSALPQVGRGRVRRVAEERDQAVTPTFHRFSIHDVIAQNGGGLGGFDHVRNRRVPFLEAGQHFSLVSRFGDGCSFRKIFCGIPEDVTFTAMMHGKTPSRSPRLKAVTVGEFGMSKLRQSTPASVASVTRF